MNIYRQIKCSDRLPEIGDRNITTFANSESGASTFSVVTKRVQDFILENKEYWLEEIELPSEDDINNLKVLRDKPTKIDLIRLQAFKQGVKFILNKLK